MSFAAVAAAPYAYIPASSEATFSVVDLANPSIPARTVDITGAEEIVNLFGVTLNTSNGMLYVSDDYDETVFQIDTATGATVRSYFVGPNPRGIAVDPSGKHVYVANFSSAALSIIDTTTHGVSSVDFSTLTGSAWPDPVGVALNLSGSRAYVTDTSVGHRLCKVDTVHPPVSLSDSDCVVVGENESANPVAVAVSPDDSLVYVVIHGNGSSVVAIDASSMSVVRTIPLGYSSPNGIVVNASGTRAYVGTGGGRIVALDLTKVRDDAQDPVIGAITDDAIGSVQGVSLSPDGTRLLAVDYTSSQLHFIDLVDDANQRVTSIGVNSGPFALGQFTPSDAIFVSGFQKSG